MLKTLPKPHDKMKVRKAKASRVSRAKSIAKKGLKK
jgi:hypothetical protein